METGLVEPVMADVLAGGERGDRRAAMETGLVEPVMDRAGRQLRLHATAAMETGLVEPVMVADRHGVGGHRARAAMETGLVEPVMGRCRSGTWCTRWRGCNGDRLG